MNFLRKHSLAEACVFVVGATTRMLMQLKGWSSRLASWVVMIPKSWPISVFLYAKYYNPGCATYDLDCRGSYGIFILIGYCRTIVHPDSSSESYCIPEYFLWVYMANSLSCGHWCEKTIPYTIQTTFLASFFFIPTWTPVSDIMDPQEKAHRLWQWHWEVKELLFLEFDF